LTLFDNIYLSDQSASKSVQTKDLYRQYRTKIAQIWGFENKNHQTINPHNVSKGICSIELKFRKKHWLFRGILRDS